MIGAVDSSPAPSSARLHNLQEGPVLAQDACHPAAPKFERGIDRHQPPVNPARQATGHAKGTFGFSRGSRAPRIQAGAVRSPRTINSLWTWCRTRCSSSPRNTGKDPLLSCHCFSSGSCRTRSGTSIDASGTRDVDDPGFSALRYRLRRGSRSPRNSRGGKCIEGNGAAARPTRSMRKCLRLIEKALSKLPARQRQAFLLRYWEEMDVAEAAKVMGCSEGSVKTHCSRATHALAAMLEKQGIKL